MKIDILDISPKSLQLLLENPRDAALLVTLCGAKKAVIVNHHRSDYLIYREVLFSHSAFRNGDELSVSSVGKFRDFKYHESIHIGGNYYPVLLEV